jgi:hypothetical protein
MPNPLNNLTRQQLIGLIAGAAVIVFLLVLGAGTYFRQGELINELPDVDTSISEDPEQAELDHLDATFVPGTDVLINSSFSDIQYLFVTESIRKFAANNFPSAEEVQINTATFARRSDREYGFSVVDKDRNHLFYVIATKLDNDKVKVDCYL